jgi:hypothetical protein
MCYWIIAILTGTFKNIADEFYRRTGVSSENQQIEKSGDVDLYREDELEVRKEQGEWGQIYLGVLYIDNRIWKAEAIVIKAHPGLPPAAIHP